MRAMLDPGLDVRSLISAGPLSFQQSVKYIQRTFTYAELVANGTTPIPIIGAVAGKWIIPISITEELSRTNGIAGTSVPCQMRYTSDALGTNIMGSNMTLNWGNGPGAPLQQAQQVFYFNTQIVFQANVGFTPRNKTVNFVPTAAHLNTGCVGSVLLTFGYIESR